MQWRFSASLALAGSLAAPAGAVTVTQVFNLANDGSGQTLITIGPNSFSQFSYNSDVVNGKTIASLNGNHDPPITENGGPLTTVSKPPDRFVKPVPLPDPATVTATGPVVIGSSDKFVDDLRYVALKFPINGVKTVGNAFFDGQHKLLAVQYASTTSVPEPDTWVELMAGFALAGAAVRRRRQRQAA